MTTEPEREDGARSSSEMKASTGEAAPLDLEKLADKVYELMRAEARLDRARGCGVQRR